MSDTVKKSNITFGENISQDGQIVVIDLMGNYLFCEKLIRGKQERIEFCKLQNIGFEKYYYDVTGFQVKR